ncbi:sulfur carrier protein ThiS [Polynucleobacter sp. UK-FUSCHL-C3]|uniref:Sulfur carrier protein ThiS n=2 Tax=Polynucleobacter sp. UK-FUSCHL-C3 TaxID=2955208 RepID=A0AAU8A5A7_9BURK
MRVLVNQNPRELAPASKVSDLLALIDAKPPYAVAVNLQFLPKSQHADYVLQENDAVEIISPVTGG